MAADDLGGNAEHPTELAHLVLEQLAQRLDELELHALGQAADVVVALDGRRGPLERHRLDDVRVERSLRQELHVAQPRAPRRSNTSMKVPPMMRRFFSGSSTPARRFRNSSAASTAWTRKWKRSRRKVITRSGLVATQDAVVDEDAGELVADGAVQQRRDHGRVDPAAEAADDAGGADPRRGCARVSRSTKFSIVQSAGARQMPEQKVGEDVGVPSRRVHDLGVELDAEAAGRAASRHGGQRSSWRCAPATRQPRAGAPCGRRGSSTPAWVRPRGRRTDRRRRRR